MLTEAAAVQETVADATAATEAADVVEAVEAAPTG
jgi:hypothetical protein|tara:strand:- start:283 stop:387 length:105 start_codon:yes stop_codon:yes gene_type:complete